MTETIRIRVGGMSCVRCSAAVTHALMQLDGVVSADVSYAAGYANIEYDPARESTACSPTDSRKTIFRFVRRVRATDEA